MVGLIGKSLKHSFSPVIHRAIGGYDYQLIELSENALPVFLKDRLFDGINVTIPYKEKVLPFLDEISPAAQAIGAVNTIVNRGGKLIGYNTDAAGLSLLMSINHIELKDKKVLILGSGGTSKTANYVALNCGAREIYRVSRSADTAGCITYDSACADHVDADVIINTTPCGMFPDNDHSPIDLEKFQKLSGVVDVIYNPLETALIRQAKHLSIPACNGLYMLVMQGIKASELFFDRLISIQKAESVYQEILHQKQNIVLIGMPGCGKTTIGKALAKALDRPFYDTDQMIEAERLCSIAAIFEEHGEKEFRAIESDVIRKVSRFNGCVIATGGGAVLDSKNIERLSQNGRLYFIDRSLDHLIPTADRPTACSETQMAQRYAERYEKYCQTADCRVNGDQSIISVAESICSDFNKGME